MGRRKSRIAAVGIAILKDIEEPRRPDGWSDVRWGAYLEGFREGRLQGEAVLRTISELEEDVISLPPPSWVRLRLEEHGVDFDMGPQ